MDTESMICHPESITVLPEMCGNEPCSVSCDLEMCKMCWQCKNLDEKYELQMAYREHRNRGAMRRVIPASLVCKAHKHYLYLFIIFIIILRTHYQISQMII